MRKRGGRVDQRGAIVKENHREVKIRVEEERDRRKETNRETVRVEYSDEAL